MMNAQEQKIAAAREALTLVKSGMRLGLGTGTTADEFVKLLGAALANGQLNNVRCTCTSNKTEALARSLGVEVTTLAELAPLDLAIDGADEIDAQLRLIKGRGGALLREKVVEQAAVRFVVIADETKLVDRLGVGTLPIEVTPFALEVLMKRFDEMSLQPVLRLQDGAPRVTDEQHRIVDVRLPHGTTDIAEVVARIRDQAGVVETGFFPTEATEAIISRVSGIEWMRRT
ncbi:MAG TPA: ribose-5-phosphate isomerase RpiA [Thermoanaerobaculia bacterium]|nr:ribose-5-phosphate isomerase RpiA [Thermoanaerobaculia bacterium]